MGDLVLSVEEVQVNTNTTSVSYNLTKDQDYTNCVPFFSVYGGQDYQDAKCIDAYFSGTTQSGVINFRRYNSRSTQVYIKCHVVEFDPSEVEVQQWTGSVSNTTTQYNPPETITQNRTGVVFYWRSSSTNQDYNHHTVRWRVNSGNTVDTYRNNNTGSVNGHFFSFEALDDQFTVEHKTATLSSTYININLSKCYDPLKTFVIGSQAYSYSEEYTDRAVCRIFLCGDGVLRADRYNSGNSIYMAGQVIEFQDNKIHVPQWQVKTLSATSGSWDWSNENRGNIAVDLDYSMVTLTSNYFHRVNSSSTAVIDHSSVGVEFASNKSINFYKNSHTETTYVSFCVVDWIGISVDTGSNASPADPDISMVKSVDNFRILANEWVGFSPLTKGQAISNCAIFANQYCSGGGSKQYTYMHDIFISNTGMVCARRSSSTGVGTVDVSVVEYYPDQVKVQNGRKVLTGTSEVLVTLPDSIDNNKSFLLSKWSSTNSSISWREHNLRCRIPDSSTIGFYRNEAAQALSVSWFVVEDLENNWETTHRTRSTTGDYHYRSDNDHFDKYSTFLLCSVAGGSLAHGYSDRSCVAAYYNFPHRPVIVNVNNTTDTKYYNMQVIQFIRDNKYYANHINITLSDGETEEDRIYTTHFSDSNTLTVSNTTLASYGRYEVHTETFTCEAFVTSRITDYNNRTITSNRVSSNETSWPSIIVINWQGTDISGGEGVPYSNATKSLVQSVESITYTGTSKNERFYLTKGQDVNNCIPIATWRVSSTDYFQDRCTVLFDFRYSIKVGYPNFLCMSNGAGAHGRDAQIYILEFDPKQVKVQHSTFGIDGTSGTATIEEVDLSKTFLLFYCYTDAWSQDWDACLTCGRFVDSTTIEFHRGDAANYIYISWFVVECLQDQWEVQHLYSTPNSTASNLYSTLNNRVNLGKTMLFGSYSGGSTSYYADRSCFRLYPRVDERIQYSKYSANDITHRINTEVVEFNKDVDLRVITDFTNLTGATTTANYSLKAEPNFDLNRSIVYNAQHESINRVDSSESADMDNGFHRLRFIDDNTVEAYRYQNSSNSYGFFFAVEFPEFKTHYIEGTVLERGAPIIREVYAYRSDSGSLMDSTTSVSGTGNFRLETTYSGSHYVVCTDDFGGFDYNNLVYGKIYPEEIERVFV